VQQQPQRASEILTQLVHGRIGSEIRAMYSRGGYPQGPSGSGIGVPPPDTGSSRPSADQRAPPHVEGRYVVPSRLREQAAVALAANGDFPH
jgi:hypothetical protein